MSSRVATRASHSVTQGRGKAKKMSDTSGRSLPLPLMRFDLASSCWRTCEDTSLWDLVMSSPTFPEWGMTRAGVLFELPTPVRPTVEQGSSSLPTPTARDHKEQTLGWTWERDGVTQEDTLPRALTALLPTPVADHSRGLAQPGTDFSSLPNVAMSLLNTPRARQGENQEIADRGHRYLEEQIATLLPTPTVMDMGSNKTPEEWEAWTEAMRDRHGNGNGHGASLSQELLGVSTPSPLIVGNESSDEQHQTPPSSDSTDDHDSTLFSWSG
jgi:hypothetical protein